MSQALVPSETQRIVRWRLDVALALGYRLEDAATIALSDIDLHRLADLLQAGCPSELALRIEAPLEGER